MSDGKPGGFSLRGWSARKLAAMRNAPERVATPAPARGATPATPGPGAAVSKLPVATAAPAAEAAPVEPELPPIDSLTPQSDFTPFMRPEVDPAQRSAALRKLFADPHFNVMDGLDVYIDDYSKPDPIAPDVVKALNHAKFIFAPPPTRVTAQGFVQDVPDEELGRSQEAPGAGTEPPVTSAPLPAIATGDAPEQIPLPLDTPADATAAKKP